MQLGQAKILSAAERAEMADVKQIKKIVPLIACEIPFSNMCELVFGVHILDLNFGVQINSVTQPIKSNSVVSGFMSHCWTSAFDDHFNQGFVILKDVQHRTKSRKLCVRRHTVKHCLDHHCRAGVEPWFCFGCACLMWCYATRFPVLDLWCC